MKIFGNKICQVCMELNSARRKYCERCKGELKHKIVSGSSKPQYFTKEQFVEDNRIFTFSEVN